jgi:hypothetical protein
LDRSRPLAEMVTKAITQANEPLTNPRQPPHPRVGSRVFLTLSEAVPLMFYLAMPCLLIKRELSSLIYKNQSDKSDKVELVNQVSGNDATGRWAYWSLA